MDRMLANDGNSGELTEYVRDASDYSDSESVSEESSSFSITDDDYEPAWIDKIGTKGDLFYVEPAVSVDAIEGDVDNILSTQKYETSLSLPDTKTTTTAEKLKQWMKHRRKKIKQSSQHFLTSEHSFNCQINSSLNVPFQASLNGEIKEVYLDVDPKRHNYGRRATLCEVLFGITIGPFNQLDQLAETTDPSTDNKIMIHGFTPDGEAIKNGNIKIGDWLKAIDGVEVTLDNINSVLMTITTPRKVKLIVQRFGGQSSAEDKELVTNYPLIKQLIGDPSTLENVKSEYLHIPHALFYLTVGKESAAEGDDVLYRYPDNDTPLYKQKGMFITLCHMVVDIASSPPLSSSVVVQEELVHVGYMMEGKELMVLALPSSCATLTEVQHFAINITKLLKLQFITLGRAFGDGENLEYLNHFFILFFHHFLSPVISIHKIPPVPHFMEILPSVHWFPLPTDLKVQVDDALSQLESADFGDMSDGYYGIRRLYNILGSCFFYKGYMLGSHLQKNDLLDIHLYLHYHHILALNKIQPVSQAIIWKEVYPTRRYQENNEVLEPGYEETDGRWFFLIVALRYSILAVLLEAGGCALRIDGHPGPDPFYVDQVRSTLLLFENSGLTMSIDKLLDASVPPLVSADSFLKEERSTWNMLSNLISRNLNIQPPKTTLTRRSLSHSSLTLEGVSWPGTGSKKMQDVTTILKKQFDIDGERQQLLSNMGPADGESDADTNQSQGTSDEMTPLQRRKHARNRSISASSDVESRSSESMPPKDQMSKHIFASAYDLSTFQKGQDEVDIKHRDEAPKLVIGCENTLFHYLHMDPVEGVFLAPTEHAQKWLQGPAHREMIDSFHRCCLNMRTVFEKSLRNKELAESRKVPKFGLNGFLQAVYEQGVLFHYNPSDDGYPKKLQPTLNFWVIGRLFFSPEPREVYVCYHDSIPQNIVELAFRLGFGLSL